LKAIVVVGGWNGLTNLASTELLFLHSEVKLEWVAGPEFPESVQGYQLVNVNGKAIAMGRKLYQVCFWLGLRLG
jgi:hypothetical protein